MLRNAVLTATIVLAATVATACGGSDKAGESQAGEGASPSAKSEAPAYTVRDGNQPNLLVAAVDTAYDRDQYEQIVADIAGQHRGDKGTFTVAFTCTQATQGIETRLAYGAFTGGQDTAEVRTFYRAACPAPSPPNQPAAPGGLTAADVLDAIIVATGLPTENPKDDTQGLCQQIHCVQALGGDGVSVNQFPDAAGAANAARLWAPEESHVRGDILLTFRFGGSTGTTPQRADQYRSALDGLGG